MGEAHVGAATADRAAQSKVEVRDVRGNLAARNRNGPGVRCRCRRPAAAKGSMGTRCPAVCRRPVVVERRNPAALAARAFGFGVEALAAPLAELPFTGIRIR